VNSGEKKIHLNFPVALLHLCSVWPEEEADLNADDQGGREDQEEYFILWSTLEECKRVRHRLRFARPPTCIDWNSAKKLIKQVEKYWIRSTPLSPSRRITAPVSSENCGFE
jgi:hypothetical protein